MTGPEFQIQAHAKVNLTLEVLGRRPDGYHNLVSIMQTVDLHDRLTFAPAAGLELACNVPELEGEANLVWKAMCAVQAATEAKHGIRITLEKRIPTAAGLGGGSSDAAAALRGLMRAWNLALSGDALMRIALDLGSDVPFFLYEGTALVQGRGENVVPLPRAHMDWIVVLAPEIQLDGKTGQMFRLISPEDYSRGVLSHKLAGRIRAGSDMPPQFMFNAFDSIADRAFPGLAACRSAFKSVGAREVVLSGAGPSLIAIAPSREIGLAWQLLLKSRGMRAFLCRAWWPDLARALPG